MTYTPQTWNNNDPATPLSAARLNYIEAGIAAGTSYYIDNAGSDSNVGTTTATAWQTLAKAAAHSYQDGDKVFFKRGGVWRDAAWVLAVANGGAFTLDAYGTGALPILSGGTLATGWAAYGGGSNSQLIANNGLETWSGGLPSSWTVQVFGSATVTQEASIIHGGSSSAKLHESSGSAEIRQTGTVTAGHSYDVSFWHQESLAGSQMKWGIQVVGGASNNFFLQADGVTWGAGSQFFKPVNTTTWAQVLVTITAPTGATGLALRLLTFSTGVTFYVDDVSMIEWGALAQANSFVSTSIPLQPSAVRVGATLATLGSGKDSLNQGEWWWGSGKLYYRDAAGSPTATGTEVEANQRDVLDASQVANIGSLTIQNVEWRHGLDRTIHIANVTGVYLIKACNVKYTGYVTNSGSISVNNNPGSGRITGNTFDHIDNDAMWFRASPNLEIDANVVTNISGVQSDGVQSSDTVGVTSSPGYNIHHNSFDFSNSNSPKGGILISNSGAGHIHHNTTYGGVRGIAPTSDGCLCEYNTCYNHVDSLADNTSSAIRFNESNCDGVIIRYNLLVDCDRGIGSYQGAGQTRSNMQIYGNTIVNPTKDGIKFVDAFSGRVYDNIVYNSAGLSGVWIEIRSIIGGQAASADHNTFGPEGTNMFRWSGVSYSTIVAWQGAVATATLNTSADPRTLGNYDLSGLPSSHRGSSGIDVNLPLAVNAQHVGGATPTGGKTGDIIVGTGKIWVNDAGIWKSVAVAP